MDTGKILPDEVVQAFFDALARSQTEDFPYWIEYEGDRYVVLENVFSPKYFHGWKHFNQMLPDVRDKSVLEIGCGAGITTVCLSARGDRRVLAVDITPQAVENTIRNAELHGVTNIEVLESDIFSAIDPAERFDLIYWNFPFLPLPDGYELDSSLARGFFDPGYETLQRFLSDAPAFLASNGYVLLGWADFGDAEHLHTVATEHQFNVTLLGAKESESVKAPRFELYQLSRFA